MICVPLELIAECPGDVSRILELESDNQTFLDLAEAYEVITTEIQDVETGIDAVSQSYYAQLRRQRDEIRAILFALLEA